MQKISSLGSSSGNITGSSVDWPIDRHKLVENNVALIEATEKNYINYQKITINLIRD